MTYPDGRVVAEAWDGAGRLKTVTDATPNDGQLTQVPGHPMIYTSEGYLRCIDNCQTGSYLTDAIGQRSLANHPNGWYEPVYLNGQTMADLDQNGTWTDYIYAKGQKIAKVASNGLPLHLHLGRSSGNDLNSGILFWADGTATNLSTVSVRAGDKLVVDGQSNLGHFALGLSDSNENLPQLTDQNGAGSFDFLDSDGGWHTHTFDMGPLIGATLSRLCFGLQYDTPTGITDSYVARLSIVRADGTTLPLYNGSPLSMTWWGGVTLGIQPLNIGAANGITVTFNPIPVSAWAGTTYFLSDQVGSTQMELSSGGWPVWQGQFTPFGQEIVNGNTTNYIGPQPSDGSAMRYKFTGKERGAESGLDYFGARYYASSMGRWMTPDWSAKEDPVPVCKAGRSYDQFHDGWLDGLLIEQASVQVFISTEEKQPYVIAANGVVALSADGFKAGNIIFEVLTKQQGELTVRDITESYGLSAEVNDQEQAQKLLGKARERGLTVLQINPSYGATRILLAESIDLLPRHKWAERDLVAATR